MGRTRGDARIEELRPRRDDDKIIPRSAASDFINSQSFYILKM